MTLAPRATFGIINSKSQPQLPGAIDLMNHNFAPRYHMAMNNKYYLRHPAWQARLYQCIYIYIYIRLVACNRKLYLLTSTLWLWFMTWLIPTKICWQWPKFPISRVDWHVLKYGERYRGLFPNDVEWYASSHCDKNGTLFRNHPVVFWCIEIKWFTGAIATRLHVFILSDKWFWKVTLNVKVYALFSIPQLFCKHIICVCSHRNVILRIWDAHWLIAPWDTWMKFNISNFDFNIILIIFNVILI